MSLPNLWFAVIAVFWTGYFVLEGFDLGVGALHRWLGRSPEERRVVVNTIGPFWDGNEVWLIVGGAAIFAAFPSWYATWFSAGYLALLLVLLALIGRGLSFEWRGKLTQPRWRSTWSWALTVGSLLIPLLLGVALGDLLAGLPIDGTEEFVGSFVDLLTPFGLMFGVTLLALSLLHGSTFVALRTTGAVRDRAHRYAGVLVWFGLALAIGSAVWTAALSQSGSWAMAAGIIPTAALIVAAAAVRGRRDGWAFTGTGIGIGGVVATLFVNLQPAVMTSSLDPAYTLTISGTASGSYALQVMTMVALVLFPFVLLYQGWGFYVFRARLRSADAPASVSAQPAD